jgi:hypothetical protein
MQHQFYLIYKTTDTLTGEYYIGQHRTNNLQDGYQGSGNWIRFKKSKNRELITEIMHFSSAESLCKDERLFIGDLWETDPYCMNECPGGGSGPHKDKTKKQISETRVRLGLKPDLQYIKGSVYMHKDGIQKRVLPTQVAYYQSVGWTQGRLTKPPKHSTTVWVNNGVEQIRTKEPSSYLNSGWSLGRLDVSYTKTKCPHCEVVGGINVMNRWHFDRCKYKK